MEERGNKHQFYILFLASLCISYGILLFYTGFVLQGGTNNSPIAPLNKPHYLESLPKSTSLRNTSHHTITKADKFPFARAFRTATNKSEPCGGRYIYVYDLPPKFNDDMVNNCESSTSIWTNKCKFVSVNSGMGPRLDNPGWYNTNQYALDAIFVKRMERYDCLTNDSSIAATFFVPFYGGFDIGRHIWRYNTSVRDATSLELFDFLLKRPEWQIMGGRDHFMVAGRMESDFRRRTNDETDWGNQLLSLPGAINMTVLVVESSPWHGNDFAVPWPTYFHPAKDAEVLNWQNQMTNSFRKWLFSFVGAPRPEDHTSIRSEIIQQCRNSATCKLLECDRSESSNCYSPENVMRTFQRSQFCLQPRGDTLTRRSIFDSMLAGCIPVFFHPGTAYMQYTWHLPRDYTAYSVFIPEDDIRGKNFTIEERLGRISPEQIKHMRETVIRLIPSLVYADPNSKLETLKDAFDVAIDAVIDRVTKLRNIIEGRLEYVASVEAKSWKYTFLGEGKRQVGAYGWDSFFRTPEN